MPSGEGMRTDSSQGSADAVAAQGDLGPGGLRVGEEHGRIAVCIFT